MKKGYTILPISELEANFILNVAIFYILCLQYYLDILLIKKLIYRGRIIQKS